MSVPSASPAALVMSYLGLRRAVGLLGLALPVVLVGGVLATGGGVLPSLSAYYYSGLRDVLVGVLWAIGVFLVSYRYARADRWWSTLAGLAAVVVSLFPTRPPNATPRQALVGTVHYVAAGTFFVCLVVFCLYLFPRDDRRRTMRRRVRVAVYVLSGLVILGALAVAGVLLAAPGAPAPLVLGPVAVPPVLALETIAVWAFALSWLVNGGALLSEPEVAAPREH